MCISQWCDLALAQRFWETKLCLRASRISKVLVARLGKELPEKQILNIITDIL